MIILRRNYSDSSDLRSWGAKLEHVENTSVKAIKPPQSVISQTAMMPMRHTLVEITAMVSLNSNKEKEKK